MSLDEGQPVSVPQIARKMDEKNQHHAHTLLHPNRHPTNRPYCKQEMDAARDIAR
jgi:hypothetical protein